MDGGFDKVNAWVQAVAPTKEVNQHHVALNVFVDTAVEAHYRPINMTSPWRRKRLNAFIKAHEDECLSVADDGRIHVPTTEFHLVFLMAHIFHHLFTEGVGLRQLMDYYFVLQSVEDHSKYSVVKSKIRDLGMERFASALMWVLLYVFGMPKEKMLCEPGEKDGRFLLEEIMKSGNWGKHDERQKGLY